MDETLAMLALEASYFKEGAFGARAVVTSLAAYSGSGTGTLTSSVVGSFGSQDGVSLSVGDNVLIPEGITNLVSPVDAGPWTLTNAGAGGTANWVLTRPLWWQNGAVIGGVGDVNPSLGSVVRIGPEGIFWPGTEWKTFAAKGTVIGTSDPVFFPGRVTQQVTLIAGSRAFSNVPIRQTTGSNPYNFFFTRSSWILATSTIMYEASAASAGYIGSALVEVFAATSIGTVAATDASIGNLTIENW